MSTHTPNPQRAPLYQQLDTWVDVHFDAEVHFLQALVQIPTDTPPGANARHALCCARLLEDMGFSVEQFPVPKGLVQQVGLQSITNLIVREYFGAQTQAGKTIALNAHGDVVPPGEGWSRDPYGAAIEGDLLFGRAAAVSKSDFATFGFALRAVKALAQEHATALQGRVELHFTYDEEFGGELGPGYLLENEFSQPDLLIAAGFSYEVITAHNGCLQLEVTVNGVMAHAAIPDSGVDALQGAVHIMNALYASNADNRAICSKVPGIQHPYLNIGRIEGGTNTNVVPGKVLFKLDRRMIPEEDPVQVEAELRQIIDAAVADFNQQRQDLGIQADIKRLLLARAMQPLPGNKALVTALQTHASAVFGEAIPALGTPLYTDVRLYAERGIPGVIYGAGPRSVRESHAKRADERLNLNDLRRATKVVARTLCDLLYKV